VEVWPIRLLAIHEKAKSAKVAKCVSVVFF